MKYLTRHLQHYLPLLAILAAGFWGIVVFSYDTNFQMVLLIATASAYVSWGVIHHHIHRDLHLSVVVEYIVIALVGIILAASILFRA